MPDDERIEIESAAELRDWLAAHHETAPRVWVVTWKQGRGAHVSYEEVVLEALCVGWVDTKGQRVDDARTSLLITPRRAGSGWSRPNKQRIAALTEAGRLQPAGAAVVERARSDGSWALLDDVEDLIEPADLSAALDAVPAARREWDGFPRSAKRAALVWLVTAKRDQTRATRIAAIVAGAAEGRRVAP